MWTETGLLEDTSTPDGQDLDDDGYSPPDDCKDTNPQIHPGAIERCNTVDDDCDGEIDEGCETVTDPVNPGGISWTCAHAGSGFSALGLALLILLLFRSRS